MKLKGKKILHITPHLGGGVGSVVLNWIEKDDIPNQHTIISLDNNNNDDWLETNENSEFVTIYNDCYNKPAFERKLSSEILHNDVVVIHWWNHPLLYQVMVNFQWPKSRLVVWNHVSSLFPPYTMPEKLIDFTDRIIFTSPVSYECIEIKRLSKEKRNKIDVIWSTVGVESFKNIKKVSHKGFNVGFTGTVDYGKLNPEFVAASSAVDVPGIKFIVCSGDSQQHLIDKAEELGVADKFSFEGRVPNVLPYLAKFDVFGYPLQPQNFATCEQSIGEAMMAGVVPVVLNNPTESYIVENMKTGIVVNDMEEYSRAIEYLYNNPKLMKDIAANAQAFAKKQYDIKKTIGKWNTTFRELTQTTKKKRNWGNISKIVSSSQLYIESLGKYSEPFELYIIAQNKKQKDAAIAGIKKLFNSNPMFSSRNKGSVLQYLRFFPEDKYLREWAELL